MAETMIEWTSGTRANGSVIPGYTFNPWIGCQHIHAGCTHCYAESYAKRYGKATWGPHGTRVKTSDAYWRQPIKWNREAQQAGERRKVFCASLADVFEDWQGPIGDSKGLVIWHRTGQGYRNEGNPKTDKPCTMDDLRRDLFALIDATPHLDWLILTKRPENVRRMWPSADVFDPQSPHKAYWQNVWLGTSVSDQPTADKYVPLLLACRDLVPVLFLSCEPLLGPITIRALDHEGKGRPLSEDIDWVIVGGESGSKARACHISWIRSIRHQCQATGVPVFIKQVGSNPEWGSTDEWEESGPPDDAKGGDPEEWPSDLRVRQFPAVEAAV